MQMNGEGVYRDGEGLERHVVRSGCNLWPWVAIWNHEGNARTYNHHGWYAHGDGGHPFNLLEYLRPLPVTMQHPDIAEHLEIIERTQIEYRELEGVFHQVQGQLETVQRLLNEKKHQCQVQHEEVVRLRQQVSYLNSVALSTICNLSSAMRATKSFTEHSNE
jgi:hypothetical protein